MNQEKLVSRAAKMNGRPILLLLLHTTYTHTNNHHKANQPASLVIGMQARQSAPRQFDRPFNSSGNMMMQPMRRANYFDIDDSHTHTLT